MDALAAQLVTAVLEGFLYDESHAHQFRASLLHQVHDAFGSGSITAAIGEEDAEDVVQEVFVELWHRKDSVTVGEQIQAFLYRAVYTRALNVLKHRDIKNSYEAAMQEVYNKRALFYQPDNNDVLKRIEDRELRKHIISAIDELPEKCKLVFKLSYLHNMKNKDIAEAMDVSLRTVEAHMYKALKFLRSRLEGYIRNK